MQPCYTCGIIPDSWTLKRGSLVPLDRTLPDDHTTVNLDVEEYGKLNFIAQVGGSADYPVYCASVCSSSLASGTCTNALTIVSSLRLAHTMYDTWVSTGTTRIS